MKKSLLALAVLGAYVGAASAQSSVTLYGTVDLSGKYVKNDGFKRRYSLARDGINSSQLGFRGVEDLGGGLKAGFNLLASVGADSGDIGGGQSATGSGKFFSRRSTVSLFSNFGELRLGRDYTPSFWNQTLFDAYGTVGVGSSQNAQQLAMSTNVRADNMIGYFLPSNLGGFYGQANVAAAEGNATSQAGQTNNAGRYLGGRLGFAAGPFDVAVAAATQKTQPFGAAAVGAPGVVDTHKEYNAGGSWNFGFLKLLGYFDYEKNTDLKEYRGSVSGVVPFGQNEIHVGYDRSRLKDTVGLNDFKNTVWQAKATYLYNLSKRTAMYGSFSYLENGNRSRNSIAGGTSITAAPTAGDTSKGGEVGVRHFF